VLTDELVRFSSPSAEMLVRDALAGAIIERIDRDFVDPAKAEVADVSPASITNGLTPIAASGTDAAAVRADLAALFAPFIAANLTPANGVFIMSSTTALALSLMRNPLGQPEFTDVSMNGGTFQGLPVITSQYVAGLGGSPVGNLLILVNASDIYLSDDGQVVIDASREASLEMADNPTNARCAGGVRRGAPPHANEVFAEVFAFGTSSAGRRNRRAMGRSSAPSFYNRRQGSDAAVTMPVAHETTAAAIATAFS
jgi:HK97 family phage major capsid protein